MNTMFRSLCLRCKSVKRLEKFKVNIIQRRAESSTAFDNPKVEDYRLSFTRPILDELGEKFLDDLDEEMLLRKKRLEFQISLWQAEGMKNIPSNLSAHNWKVILTQMNTLSELERYLKKVHVRADKMRTMMEDNVICYDALCQPYEDEDLHIIQRIFSMKKYLNQWNGTKSLLHGMPLVIDMDYENTSESDNYETARQIENLYNFNLEHHQPCHLHFTSFHKSEFLVKLHRGNRNITADFHRKNFLQVFPDHNLFYLVPEAEMISENELDEDVIFVMGGIGGTGERGRSLKRAKALGIPYGSLPIDRYLLRKKRSTKDIYLHTVTQILLDKMAGVSWKVALERHLPEKKFEKFPGLPGTLTFSSNVRKSYKQFENLDKILVSKS